VRAVVYDSYGPPDVLRLEEVERPVPKEDDVLLRLPGWYLENVIFLKEFVEAGKFRPVIDRCYPLEDVIEATRYVETEQKTGNVALSVVGAKGTS
jgi:NADPH:quinone reductase-like Zn-dependent oxidoreductase